MGMKPKYWLRRCGCGRVPQMWETFHRVHVKDERFWFVECIGCRARPSTSWFKTRTAAARQWNSGQTV